MNIIIIFLTEDIDKEIYMKQSKGFEEEKDLVYKFKKSLYDFKQNSCIWNKKIRGFLKFIEFKRINANHYIYTSKSGVIIMIYINDLFIFGKKMREINEIKKKLITMFEMKNIRKLK